ncbi:uncharacterized protein LOC124453051 [Xenia sp. Carnegie-2017]|uniref:uncharacterized protein LOC124453051 n=1 Tax=Xenia sp. Carnegie-2017 TaxID=2897299 RepID=UPI001F04CF67|nr:uncharacterized protein LOC124453051 [Xenia sp. Carnegie-2017]
MPVQFKGKNGYFKNTRIIFFAVFFPIFFTSIVEGIVQVDISNISTIQGSPTDISKRHYNVTLRWHTTISPRNTTIVPTFKILVTYYQSVVKNITKLVIDSVSNNSFMYVLKNVRAGRNYVLNLKVYIKSSFHKELNTTFDVIRIFDKNLFLVSGSKGYLNIDWSVVEEARHSSLPIYYNVSLCSSRNYPRACKNVYTVCLARYQYRNHSAKGEVTLLEKNWHEFRDNDFLNVRKPLKISWDSKRYQFRCAIYLDVCRPWRSNFPYVQYVADYGEGQRIIRSKGIRLHSGFSFERPQLFDVTILSQDEDDIKVQLHWRLAKTCLESVATTIIVQLLKNSVSTEVKKYGFLNFPPYGEEDFVEDTLIFSKLEPFSRYTIQFTSESNLKKSEITTHQFYTPEVATSPPDFVGTIEGSNKCAKNKRNVSISWKLPPLHLRKGIIRSIILKYYVTKQPQASVVELTLPNITRYTVNNLDCDKGYSFQVRACIHVNSSCSNFSKIYFMPYALHDTQFSDSSWKYALEVGLGVGCGVIFLLCILLIVYCCCKKRKPPLEELQFPGEDYCDTNEENEMSRVNNYSILG